MRSDFNGERDEREPASHATTSSGYEDVADSFRPWDYRTDVGWSPEYDLVGYHVEAIDGSIGKVKETSYAQHGSYLVVDTGPWIFGRTVVIPAGIVTNIDHDGRRIFLDRAKEPIKSSPDYSDDPVYWEKLAAHYRRA